MRFLLNILLVACIIVLAHQQGALERRQSIPPEGFIFDLFGSTPTVVGQGGTGQRVAVEDLPLLNGLGVSSVLFRLTPCSINLPHVHPRATELFHVLEGEFLSGVLEENLGRYIQHNITVGQVSVFPQGLIHFEQNIGCTNATFLSAFSSEDPGVLTIANRLFDIDQQALTSTFNQDDDTINNLRTNLGVNPALGRGECLKRCNLA